VKAFVTGGTGFVGAHLVQQLLADGVQVTCLVRSPAKAAALGWRGVRIVRGDLSDRQALMEGCAGADVIFHVAGLITARDLNHFMSANRDATGALLAVAAEHPPGRFVYVSSQAAGGPNTPGRPRDETDPPRPVSDYGRSKLAGELLVRTAGLPWTIVRPPVVYGEWDREVLKVFKAARLGVAPVFGDGSQEISLLYAGDLARALATAATTPAAAGRVYYAAHPQSVTTRSLVLAVGRALQKKPVVVPIPRALARGALAAIGSLARMAGRATLLSADKANEFLAPGWVCSSAALTRDTGWRAEVDLESGLRRTAAWYREHRWL
jgi:nucleoside-diphosphate-sugar epimerase